MDDKNFLNWLADRLVNLYAERESTDFVIRLRKIASQQNNPNILTIKKLPWTCGDCGKQTVQNLRLYEDVNGHQSLIADCDNCGWECIT